VSYSHNILVSVLVCEVNTGMLVVCIYCCVFTTVCGYFGLLTQCVCMCIEGEYCPWEKERLSGVWLEEEEAGFVQGSTTPDDHL